MTLEATGFPEGATARRLYGMVLSRLRTKLMVADAQDLAGDVMLAFVDYRGECKPETFALSVMHRRLADLQRQRMRRGPLIAVMDVDELADEPAQPELALDLPVMLECGLRGVQECFRDVVALSLLGLRVREIADELEINPNTTRSRLARGREQFRAHLDKFAEVSE